MELTANYKTHEVSVKQVGPNESAVNGNPIGIGIQEIVKGNDTVDVLFGQYRYRVVFEGLPPPPSPEIAPKPAKIPRMFLNGDQFKKDNLLPKGGQWTSKGEKLHIYTFGDSIRRAKANVSHTK